MFKLVEGATFQGLTKDGLAHYGLTPINEKEQKPARIDREKLKKVHEARKAVNALLG